MIVRFSYFGQQNTTGSLFPPTITQRLPAAGVETDPSRLGGKYKESPSISVPAVPQLPESHSSALFQQTVPSQSQLSDARHTSFLAAESRQNRSSKVPNHQSATGYTNMFDVVDFKLPYEKDQQQSYYRHSRPQD
jgi:hypothetical protein